MINSFSQFLVEEEKTVYFTFGRLNPPTMGHEMLLNKLAKAAGRNPYKIYLSKSTDPKKNPLTYNDKVKFARKMFPKHARQIIKDDKIKTVMDIATTLYNEGYVNVVMAVDGPRSREFDILLNKYNGVQGRHGFYNFKSIKFVNVGERNDSSEGIDGVSATKQRNAAKGNDFVAFTQGLPKTMSNREAKRLFNAVRTGMGLKEATEFKRHIQLAPVSETREQFIQGELFELGEQVIIKKTDEVGTITVLGSNYVIVETTDRKTRQWLDAVEKIEEAQKWKKGGPDGEVHTQHKGTTWRVRKDFNHNDRHVGEYRIEYKKKNPYGGHDWEWHDTVRGKEHAKSRLPEATQPGEGTPAATARAKKMTPGENAMDVAKQRINREKQADAKKHDRILDRARIVMAKKKNKATKPGKQNG